VVHEKLWTARGAKERVIQDIVKPIELAASATAIAGIGYCIVCVWTAVVFLAGKTSAGEGSRATSFAPPVSILKPLRGTDPEMYENFRSHCLQDYPEYEIIFGVSDANDPAIEVVKRLQSDFPQIPILLVVCGKDLGANIKVSNLAQVLAHARYEYLVVSDSDIRVERDYLLRVLAPFEDPGTGLVTCLYRGVASPTLGSRLEALGISTDFAPGVLAARQLEGNIRFGLGSTLAFRRPALDTIGGFEALVDYLADDYELGARLTARGLKGKLSEVVVETFLPAYSFPEFVEHQLRWNRTIRASRPWGYIGLLFTFIFPWSLLALLCARGATWVWGVFSAAVLARTLCAIVIGRLVLKDPQVTRSLWLLPLRDLIAFLLWLGSFAGKSITWRGKRFHLQDGKLIPHAEQLPGAESKHISS
jgi:ceramide glucosyltransferase